MRFFIFLIFLVFSPIYGKELHLAWNESGPEDVYYVYRWPSDPYTNPNIRNELTYPYYRYCWNYEQVTVHVPDDEVSYLAVLSRRGEDYGWSQVVKHTPNRTLQLKIGFGVNPIKELTELKLEIIGDAGTHVTIQSSTDLINWVDERTIIVGNWDNVISGIFYDPTNFDKTILFFPMVFPMKYFRAYKRTWSGPYPELVLMFTSLNISDNLTLINPVIEDPIIDPIIEDPEITTPVKVKTKPTSKYKRPKKPHPNKK